MTEVSVPPSDLPALTPGDYHELRVHGVAGTTPESMLGLAATMQATGTQGTAPAATCPVDAPPGDVSVWQPPDVRPELRAFSWSSLTSGHWYQAFYLVLLPFMIANLAGWMIVDRVPVERSATMRCSAFLVRAIGLLVTGVFVVSIQIVVADLVLFQWLRPGRWMAVGTPATAVVLLGAVALTRIRQQPRSGATPPWSDVRDPVGTCSLHVDQPRMWDSPGINVTLRQLHLAAGLATIALLAAWPGTGAGQEPWGSAAQVLAVGTGAVAVGMLAVVSLGDGRTRVPMIMKSVRWLSVPAGLAIAAATVHQAVLDPELTRTWIALPGLGGAMVWIALAVFVGILVLAVVGFVAGRGGWAAVNAPGMLLVAASVGAMLGAGLAAQVVRFTGPECGGPAGPCPGTGDYVTWLAVGVTTAIAGLVAVAVVRAAWFARGNKDRRVVAHLITENGHWITAVLLVEGVLLLAAGLLGVVGVAVPAPVTAVIQSLVVVFVAGPLVVGAVVAAWRGPATGRRRAHLEPEADGKVWLGRIAALLVLGGLGYVVVATSWTHTVLGVALPPRTFADLALDVAILLPTAAVLTRIYSGLTKVGVRRGVGILWDVGTFWPRWFHPFAPPTYSDRAVQQLIAQIDKDLGDEHRMLLAPHSQGAVIAAAAVLGAGSGADLPGLAMLSYGSPWHHLYSVFFPLHVNGDATRAVVDRLGGKDALRWRNLHRETDPIGGAIPDVPETVGRADPCGRGHSDYWIEDFYVQAAGELRGLLGSADSAAPTCSASVTATSTCSRSGRRIAVDEVST